MTGSLVECLARAAGKHPERIAMADREGALTYGEFADLSGRLRDRLWKMNVRRGDRVGIYMRNSVDACAAMLGVLRAGATYVSIPARAPAAHAALLTHANQLTVVIGERDLLAAWREEMANYGATPATVEIGTPGGGLALWLRLHQLQAADPRPEQLAYIA